MNTEPFRPVRGIGLAASVLIGLDAVFAIGDAITSERVADAFTLMVTIASMLVTIAAGVTFIVWLYRSRCNAERVTYDVDHRHKRGWAIGAWFVPILNLWYPYQIVQDVWRAFSPAQQDRPLQARDQSGFITAWWFVYLFMSWGGGVVTRLALSDADLPTVATWTWVSTLVTIAAAVLAVVLIRRLTDLQDRTRPQEFSGPVQVHVPGA